MKRWAAAVLVGAAAAGARAGPVTPEAIAATNYRGEAVAALTNVSVYRGDTLILTNWAARGASAAVTQALSGVTVVVTLGDATLPQTYTGTVTDATGGVWSAVTAVPEIPAHSCTIQVRLTDGTNWYTYPHKTVPIKSRL